MYDTRPASVKEDRGHANGAVLFLLGSLAFFSWLLFDTWVDAHTLFRVLGYPLTRLQTPIFHLVAYTIIGGAMGGVVNGLRSALLYYTGFNRRYFWKYIAAPWMGAALAVIGFALMRSTVAIFGGDSVGTSTATPQFLANFAIGALAGYGSKDVFIWLDEKVSQLFKVEKETPDVTGKLAAVAESRIHAENLAVGEVAMAAVGAAASSGRVVDQSPAPGTPIESGESVDLIVGAAPNGEEPC